MPKLEEPLSPRLRNLGTGTDSGASISSVRLASKYVVDLLVRISNRGNGRWCFILPHDVSLMNRLLFWCAPLAIQRGVVVLRIYPVQRCAARPWSHVGEEVLETISIWFKPTVADTNALASMKFVDVLTILLPCVASLHHCKIAVQLTSYEPVPFTILSLGKSEVEQVIRSKFATGPAFIRTTAMPNDIVRKLASPKFNRVPALTAAREHIRAHDANDGKQAKFVISE